MSERPRLVLFDCDGTLADSEASIVGALREAFREQGLVAPDASAIRQRVGLSLGDFLSDLAPGLEASERTELAARYRSCFARHHRDQGPEGVDSLFPGIAPLLRQLSGEGVLLGVVTGKSRRGLVRLLEAHRLRPLFATLQTADDGPGKPNPALVQNALAETGSSPGATVMIGDTDFDIRAARAAGVHAWGVTWGYHPTARLLAAGAERIVERVEELGPALGLA